MTTIYQCPTHTSDMPGTHVLVIAVGEYPQLVGGNDDLVEEPMGLGQLSSPPISAAAIIQWFLGGGLACYHNPAVPLASIEVAMSPNTIILPDAPTSTVVDTANIVDIERCFETWRQRCIQNSQNIGVFYFCGHGVMAANHFLLASDFGGSNPWRRAFDLTNTVRALEREIVGPMYFFIDACRQIPRALASKLGATAPPLRTFDLNNPVVNTSRLVLYAAGEGKQAFALHGQISRYTAALIETLSGYAGRKRTAASEWEVTAEDIARSVRRLLEAENAAGAPLQVVEQNLRSPTAFHVGSAPPKVKVSLDLKPDTARPVHTISLEQSGGAAQETDGTHCPWHTEVPRGFYHIGVRAQGANNPAILLENEELDPPCYNYTINV